MEDSQAEVMNFYVLKEGTHRFKGQSAGRGDRIQLTDKEANKLGNRVTRVSEKVGKSEKTVTSSGTSTVTSDWSHTQEMKAPDLITLINEQTDEKELMSIHKVEEQGQNRIGVLNAIKKRVAQVKGE